MVVVMQVGASEAHVENVIQHLSAKGFDVLRTSGQQQTVLCAIGVKRNFQIRQVRLLDSVAEVHRITTPYKLASRTWQQENSVVPVGNSAVGAEDVVLMDRLVSGMTRVSESGEVESAGNGANLFHISGNHLQNASLLKAVGRTDIPVLLRRHSLASIEEWLVGAEIVLKEGNPNVILCEGGSGRGITGTSRSLLPSVDISVIPDVKKNTHLPIVVDPTVVEGGYSQQFALARAAVAAGADGIWIETHLDDLADSHSGAAYKTEREKLLKELNLIAEAIGRSLKGISP